MLKSRLKKLGLTKMNELLEGSIDVADTSAASLQEVRHLYEKRQTYVKLLATAEEQVIDAQAIIKRLDEGTIPDRMDELGITRVDMDDGSILTVESFVYARVPHSSSDACHSWLKDNGHGDIIKDKVSFDLKKGQDNMARAILNVITEQFGIDGKQPMSVHWKTLESWAREMLEGGHAIPDSFDVHAGRRAKVK